MCNFGADAAHSLDSSAEFVYYQGDVSWCTPRSELDPDAILCTESNESACTDDLVNCPPEPWVCFVPISMNAPGCCNGWAARTRRC